MAMSAAAPESPSTHRSTRLAEMVQLANGINAARVFASVLVVVFHAAVPYMTSPIPIWVVHDTAQHVSVDMLVFWVNGFAMPLFFLLAGWSIAKSSAQRPFWEFAWHRTSRLVQTFLLALVLIVPMLLFIWGFGLLLTERVTISNLTRLNFPESLRSYIGPCHLWFLEYLLILSLVWSALARIGRQWPAANWWIQGYWAERVFTSPWGAMLLAIPTAIILLIDVETAFRLIPRFAPDLGRLSYYFVFVAAGVWLANQSNACSILRTNAVQNLLLATLVFVGLGPLTMSIFDQTLTASGRWMVAGLQAIFAWSMTLGFLGAMVRWFSKPNEIIRYNHEASFWVYLAHLPIVCMMQLLLLEWPFNHWLKISMVATIGMLVSLITYQCCIRYSVLGAVVNGRRIPHAVKQGWRLEAGWLSLVTVIVTLVSGFLWIGWNSICNQHVHLVDSSPVFRCNRPPDRELEIILQEKQIRTVISLAIGRENDDWFRAQRQICHQLGVSLITLSLDESQVPKAADIAQLQTALVNSPRPVLLIGGKRSPTLASFGAAVAVLVDGGAIEMAMQQFDMRFFQLEGPERCLLAKPLREYRTWLKAQRSAHSAANFGRWSSAVLIQAETNAASTRQQPDWQANMGAPRYPRRF